MDKTTGIYASVTGAYIYDTGDYGSPEEAEASGALYELDNMSDHARSGSASIVLDIAQDIEQAVNCVNASEVGVNAIVIKTTDGFYPVHAWYSTYYE